MSNPVSSKFYKDLQLQNFIDHASVCGVDSCCDIDNIYNQYIKHKKSVLEVGAGYGRVLAYLIQKKYKGEIFALERNVGLYKGLLEKHGEAATISNDDFFDYPKTNYSRTKDCQFDTILLLWSFISEFSKEEQLKVFQHLNNYMKKDSRAFVDILDISYLKVQEGFSQQVTEGADSITLYFPSPKEIENYCRKAGFSIESSIKYKTSSGIKRIVFIIVQSN